MENIFKKNLIKALNVRLELANISRSITNDDSWSNEASFLEDILDLIDEIDE